MSQINVNRIKDSNEGAPDFPSGVNVSGVTSTVTLGVTNLNPTNVNVSGVVTATTLDGNLLATGTPTLGLGVTINTSGIVISGVATAGIVSATTFFGDGSALTGVGLSIAPLNYNPAVLGSELAKTTGIGLTFNQAVKAGSGNVTLSIANAGVAGTVVENFGVGNSVTYGHSDYGTAITITPTSSLNLSETYHLSYPSGAFTNIGGDVSYVGTAYTFGIKAAAYQMWAWGRNNDGALGLNQAHDLQISSPTQIPGTAWIEISSTGRAGDHFNLIKNDNTLWAWGDNDYGELGQNNTVKYSSPVQVGSDTTWSSGGSGQYNTSHAVKTDGTLWMWGRNLYGQLGQNAPDNSHQSSPVQIPGTTWSSGHTKGNTVFLARQHIKTDGTLWVWGHGTHGKLAQNNLTTYSSPIQIPGTNWSVVSGCYQAMLAIKTDGTLWSWGYNDRGALGHNNRIKYSSPVQVPGTTWSKLGGCNDTVGAIKTDGTLWCWGWGYDGRIGDGTTTSRSSPTQIPGTTWSEIGGGEKEMIAIKTDGTMWAWGSNTYGGLGQNNKTNYSSPKQIPGTNWSSTRGNLVNLALKEI